MAKVIRVHNDLYVENVSFEFLELWSVAALESSSLPRLYFREFFWQDTICVTLSI